MKKSKSIFDDIPQPVSDGKWKSYSFHLDDEYSEVSFASKTGVELVKAGYETLSTVVSRLQATPDFNYGDISALMGFPLEHSDFKRWWSARMLDDIGILDEPPSLYFVEGEMFDRTDEAVEDVVQIPFPADANTRALFRSHRSKAAAENGWEFANTLFLITKLNRV